MNHTLTALNGVKVGHSTHPDKLTGCTVISFDKKYPVAYKTYGGYPGTYDIEDLKNGSTESGRHGLFITGGSNNGLMAASEIVAAMIEEGQGDKVQSVIKPRISGAVVFDLGLRVGQFDPRYGREAYENVSAEPVVSGNVGAGTGTSVGKFASAEDVTKHAGMKAGVGSSRVDLGNGIIVCALSVVNAIGNIVSRDGSILAGCRDQGGGFKAFKDTTEALTGATANTTITVVGINVDLGTRENYERIAHFGTQGQVRAVYPVHTSLDGDTVFVFSTEEIKSPLNEAATGLVNSADWAKFTVDMIGDAAARATQESIYDACLSAETIKLEAGYKGVVPSVRDIEKYSV